MWSESSDRILWIVRHSLVLRSILDKKTKQFSFLYENFHILYHLLISRLNGDDSIANETCIQTTATTSVSTCRPAYCFRQRCWEMQYRNTILVGLLYSRCEICVFIFYLRLSFCSRSSSFSNNVAPHDLPNHQSINQSINQYISTSGKHGVYLHIS